MQLDQALGDRQAKAGPPFRRLMRERALAEAPQDARDLLVRNAGPRVTDAEELAAFLRPPDDEGDRSAGRRELDGIRQKVQADLAKRLLVGPKLRQVRLELLDDA